MLFYSLGMHAPDYMRKITHILIDAFKRGNILFLCGNGGSNDLANHMEEEFICKFKKKRKALPAIALKSHTSTSNDYGYEYVFSRQLEALGKEGDILIGFSTSGKSQNILEAYRMARIKRMIVIDFPRKGKTTSKIQEYQLREMHKIAEKVEEAFI